MKVSRSQGTARSVEWAEVGKSTLAVGSVALRAGVSGGIKGENKGEQGHYPLFFLTPQNVRSHLMLPSL